MDKGEKQYLDLLQDVLDNGKFVGDRTNTGCIRVFSRSMRFDLSKGIPLYTTKKIRWENVIGELLWMLSGKTDLPSLREYQCKPEGDKTIWSDDFAKFWDRKEENSESIPCYERLKEEGGDIYGKQLRGYGTRGVDQLKVLLENITATKEDNSYYMGRRLKCEFWNPEDHLDYREFKSDAALPACHTGFQCMVDESKLNLKFNMRSNDLFLGNPYNVFFYGVLTHILAKLTGLQVGELVYDGTDCHIYSDHVEQVKEQLTRVPKKFPELVLPEFETLEELLSMTAGDFDVVGYEPCAFIAARQAS